jgi:hypothetical protein
MTVLNQDFNKIFKIDKIENLIEIPVQTMQMRVEDVTHSLIYEQKQTSFLPNFFFNKNNLSSQKITIVKTSLPH